MTSEILSLCARESPAVILVAMVAFSLMTLALQKKLRSDLPRQAYYVCLELPVSPGLIAALSRCGFCSAPFDPAFKGQVCAVCQVGEIGLKGTGLINSRHQRNKVEGVSSRH